MPALTSQPVVWRCFLFSMSQSGPQCFSRPLSASVENNSNSLLFLLLLEWAKQRASVVIAAVASHLNSAEVGS